MRRSKLSPKLTKKLVQAIKAGNYVEISCTYAGISHTSYYNWINRAEAEIERLANALEEDSTAKVLRDEKKYVEFLEAVRAAESEAEIVAVATIRSAFKGDWRASMAFLERRFPDRWGRRVIGFKSDDGSRDFAAAFANALSDVEDEELEASSNVSPIR